MLQENVHAKIVSERLGHSSIRRTLDKYSMSPIDAKRDS
ncbi:hypothetical protein [Salibacterium aidingense]